MQLFAHTPTIIGEKDDRILAAVPCSSTYVSWSLTDSEADLYGQVQARELILIYNKVEFDAVFAFTDTLAIGAQNRLRALGRRVPEEIFVAGFSGTELSTIVSPQITTMEPPLEEMGRKAAELVMEKINNPEMEDRQVVLKTTMRCRESTGE